MVNIRLPIPDLSEERRNEIKNDQSNGEKCKINRNIRREAIMKLKTH